MIKNHERCIAGRRFLSLLLALAVAAAFTPVFSNFAYAYDNKDEIQPVEGAYLVNDDGSETWISDEEYLELKKNSLPEPPSEIEVELETGEEASGTTGIELGEEAGKETGDDNGGKTSEVPEDETAVNDIIDITPDYQNTGKAKQSYQNIGAPSQESAENPYYDVSFSVSGTEVTVKGKISDDWKTRLLFGNLYIDSQTDSGLVSQDSYWKDSFSVTIDMSSFSVGYHTLYFQVLFADESGNLQYAWDAVTKVPRNITEIPDYAGVFDVYSGYFNYYPFDFGCNMSYPSGSSLYMEYKADGNKTWKRSGYMKANAIKLYIEQGYAIKGLKSNKTYKTRLVYGGYYTYSSSIGGDDKEYFFKGPAFKSKTIKTGKSRKPSVKSVTAKAVNVKYHKVRHPGGYYWSGNVLLYQNAWTERFYTCNVKVTVRLKQKPGTKGIFLSCSRTTTNTKWLKGNKKTYTATFTPYPDYYAKKPNKYKLQISVCSGQNKSWGGRSPMYKKTKKIS